MTINKTTLIIKRNLLKSFQFLLLRDTLHISSNSGDKGLVFHQYCNRLPTYIRNHDMVLHSPKLQTINQTHKEGLEHPISYPCIIDIRHNNCDERGLQTVSINTYLGHKGTVRVRILDLLNCNVFALTELKDVLFTVNDLERAVLGPKADVPTVQPTIIIQSLLNWFF